MSSKSGNEHAENFLLFAIVGGLILAGALYVFYLFLPYLIFYILPFVVGSLVVGFILRMAGEPGDGVLSLSRYRAVVMAYAFCLLVVGVTCFSNVTRAWVVDKNGKSNGQVILDWPKANQYFNQWRSSTYAGSPLSRADVQRASDENHLAVAAGSSPGVEGRYGFFFEIGAKSVTGWQCKRTISGTPALPYRIRLDYKSYNQWHRLRTVAPWMWTIQSALLWLPKS